MPVETEDHAALDVLFSLSCCALAPLVLSCSFSQCSVVLSKSPAVLGFVFSKDGTEESGSNESFFQAVNHSCLYRFHVYTLQNLSSSSV